MNEHAQIMSLSDADLGQVRAWLARVRFALRRGQSARGFNHFWRLAKICPRGHARDVYVRPNGFVECRTCMYRRIRAYRARHRDAVNARQRAARRLKREAA